MTSKAKKNKYWKDEQELLVIEYGKTEPHSTDRDRIASRLYPSVFRICEEVIKRYFVGTFTAELEYETIEVTTHVFDKLDRYDKDANTKAFSFVQTVAKNYLLTKYDSVNCQRNIVHRNQDSIHQTTKDEDDENGSRVERLMYDIAEEDDKMTEEEIREVLLEYLEELYEKQTTRRTREYVEVLIEYFNIPDSNLSKYSIASYIIEHPYFATVKDRQLYTSYFYRFGISLPFCTLNSDPKIGKGMKSDVEIDFMWDDYTPNYISSARNRLYKYMKQKKVSES